MTIKSLQNYITKQNHTTNKELSNLMGDNSYFKLKKNNINNRKKIATDLEQK